MSRPPFSWIRTLFLGPTSISGGLPPPRKRGRAPKKHPQGYTLVYIYTVSMCTVYIYVYGSTIYMYVSIILSIYYMYMSIILSIYYTYTSIYWIYIWIAIWIQDSYLYIWVLYLQVVCIYGSTIWICTIWICLLYGCTIWICVCLYMDIHQYIDHIDESGGGIIGQGIHKCIYILMNILVQQYIH